MSVLGELLSQQVQVNMEKPTNRVKKLLIGTFLLK